CLRGAERNVWHGGSRVLLLAWPQSRGQLARTIVQKISRRTAPENSGRASSGDSRPASSAYLPQCYLTRRHPPTPPGCLDRGKSPVNPHSRPLPGQRERQRTLSVSHPLTLTSTTWWSVSRKESGQPQ